MSDSLEEAAAKFMELRNATALPTCPFRLHARNVETAHGTTSRIEYVCQEDCALAIETPDGLRCSMAILAGDILTRTG